MLPLQRALQPDETIDPTLVVVLRHGLARRSVTGTLVIEARNYNGRFCIVEGSFELDKNEHSHLIRAFDLEEAHYHLEPEINDRHGRKSYGMASVALDGLRCYLRQFEVTDIAAALGTRIQHAPVLQTAHRALIRRLGFSPREQRFADLQMDGTQSGRELIVQGGLGKHTTAGLLVLLHMFELLDWHDATAAQRAQRGEELAELATKIEHSNYFETLGVHWSTNSEEVVLRYRSLEQQYAAGGVNDEANPKACALLRKRIHEAFECLRDEVRRNSYRKTELGDIDFEAATELESARSEALAMQGRSAEAKRSQDAITELSRSIDKNAVVTFVDDS